MLSQPPTKKMICGFKVNTNSPGWYKSLTKFTKKIKGANFTLDAEEGIGYMTGEVNPTRLLKLIGANTGKDAEVAWVKTGKHNNPNYNNVNTNNYCSNYYHYGQVDPYDTYDFWSAYYSNYPSSPADYNHYPSYHDYHYGGRYLQPGGYYDYNCYNNYYYNYY